MLIEDNPDHALLIRAALETLVPPPRLTVLSDGAQALEYIRAEAVTSALELPGVVLLDLRLPKVDGLDVLRAMRASSVWRQVPVIVLTTSNHSADRQACYANGANFYLSKVLGLKTLVTDLRCALDVIGGGAGLVSTGPASLLGPHRDTGLETGATV